MGRGTWSSGGVLAVGLLAMFCVPYLFGHGDGHSHSYLVHYSNRVAEVLLFGVMAALGWSGNFGLRYGGREREGGSRWPLYVAAGLSIALVGVLWGLERRFGAMGEAMYFLDRYAAHDLGARLYRDMEFSYGPLLFWPQMWVSQGLGVSRGSGHFAVLLVEWPVGIGLLWYVCRRLGAERRVTLTMFALLCGNWCVSEVDGGVNYTPLRFLAGPTLALAMYGMWRRGVAAWVFLAVGLAGFTGLMFFSPEQGVAFGFATVVFFAGGVRSRELLGFVVGCGAVVWVVARVGVFRTMVQIAGGLLDFPLLPSLCCLIVLTAAVVGGALAVGAVRRGEARRPEVYVSLIALALVPSALGRADAGHIFVNLLPLVAVAFVALAQTKGGYRLATGALLLLMLVDWKRHDTPAVKTFVAAWRVRGQTAPAAAEESGAMLAPLGYKREFGRAVPVPVFVGRYPGYLELMSATEPAEKIGELARRPELALVMPKDAVPDACVEGETRRRNDLNSALRPWFIPRARAVDGSTAVLCDYVVAHYARTAKVAPGVGYEIWEPKAGR